MLGGVSMTNNISHYDSKSLTLMIKCIVDQVRTLPTEIHNIYAICERIYFKTYNHS